MESFLDEVNALIIHRLDKCNPRIPMTPVNSAPPEKLQGAGQIPRRHCDPFKETLLEVLFCIYISFHIFVVYLS